VWTLSSEGADEVLDQSIDGAGQCQVEVKAVVG